MSNTSQEDISSIVGFKILSVIVSSAATLYLVSAYYSHFSDRNPMPQNASQSTPNTQLAPAGSGTPSGNETTSGNELRQGSRFMESPTPDSLSAQPNLNGERYPLTRLRLLTANDIQGWNYETLRYAINEMYARRGADFRDKDIKKWFSSYSWYRPVKNKSYDAVEAEFTYIEKSNLDLLGSYRNASKRAR